MTMQIREEVPIRSLVLSGVDLAAYQSTVLREAEERLAVRQRGLAAAEEAVTEAERGMWAAEYAGIDEQYNLWETRHRGAQMRVTRRKNEIDRAEKFLSLVRDGYLPIPMLPRGSAPRWLRDPLPPEVLETLGNETLLGRFQEFQVIGMPEQRSRQRRRRDPILVGICDDEMFPLAWWR